MPLPNCSYVELAVRLGRDVRYREWASDLISGRSWSLWERKEVVVEWARFLSRAAGRPAPLADEVGFEAHSTRVRGGNLRAQEVWRASCGYDKYFDEGLLGWRGPRNGGQ